jgi:hypothetical protein
MVLVAVLVVGGGLGAYLLLRNGDKTGNQNGSGASGAAGKTGGPGRFQMSKLPENVCGTIDMGPINKSYEAAAGDPNPSRALNTYASTATCSISRMHKAGNTVATATVMSMVTVYADVTAAKQMRDSARLNSPLTEIKGVGEDAVTYIDQKQPAVLTATFFGIESNVTVNLTLVASPLTGTTFTDEQRKELQTRLGEVGKATFPRTVAAFA